MASKTQKEQETASMTTFGVAIALLGGLYSMVVAAVTAKEDGQSQEKPSHSSQRDTTKPTSRQDN